MKTYVQYIETEISKTESNIELYKLYIFKSKTGQNKTYYEKCLKFEENVLDSLKAQVSSVKNFQENCVKTFGNNAEPWQAEDCDIDLIYEGRYDD